MSTCGKLILASDEAVEELVLGFSLSSRVAPGRINVVRPVLSAWIWATDRSGIDPIRVLVRSDDVRLTFDACCVISLLPVVERPYPSTPGPFSNENRSAACYQEAERPLGLAGAETDHGVLG
jgi:hypothetical protein